MAKDVLKIDTLDNAQMVERYLQGESATDLAKSYGVCKSTIIRRLKRIGIETRSVAEANRNGYRIHGKEGRGRKRIYTCNQDYFSVLSPNVAYLVGFIQADGTVLKDRWNIALQLADRDFLECLKSEIGSNRPLQKVSHKFGDVLRMQVNSSKMVNDIRAWGIVENKTYCASTHPRLLLDRDYWRGVIDGDGTLHITKRNGSAIIRLTGTPDICEQFRDFCHSIGCGLSASVLGRKDSPAKSFGVHGYEASALGSVLYDDAVLFLPRKRSKYLQFKERSVLENMKAGGNDFEKN